MFVLFLVIFFRCIHSVSTPGYESSVYKLRYKLIVVVVLLPLAFRTLRYIVSVEDTLLKYLQGYCFSFFTMLEECLHTGVVYVSDEG